MKRYLLILCIALSAAVNAQKALDLKAVLPLGKKEDVLDVVTLGDQGFLIQTGISYGARAQSIKVHRFDADLTKRFSIVLPKPKNGLLMNMLIGSKYSEYVYSLQQNKTGSGQNGIFVVTRVDSLGKLSNFSVPISSDLGNVTVLAAFENEEKLVLLTSRTKSTTSKEIINGKKQKVTSSENKLEMFVMKHEEKTFQKMKTEIELSSNDPDVDLTVEFLGNDEETFYVARKSVNLGNGITNYSINVLSMEGEILETNEIKSDIKYVPLASRNLRETSGAVVNAQDYDVIVTHSGKTTITTYVAKAGAFGCSQLDIDNGYFYVYGIATDKLSRTKNGKTLNIMSNTPNSFYVQKYELVTGELISDYFGKLPKSVLDDKFFNTTYFNNRCIGLHVVDSELVRLNLYSLRSLHTLSINYSSDKLTHVSQMKNHMYYMGDRHDRSFASLFVTAEDGNPDMVKFLKKFPSFREKDYSVFGISFGHYTAVVKNSALSKTPKLEMQLFDNSIR